MIESGVLVKKSLKTDYSFPNIFRVYWIVHKIMKYNSAVKHDISFKFTNMTFSDDAWYRRGPNFVALDSVLPEPDCTGVSSSKDD